MTVVAWMLIVYAACIMLVQVCVAVAFMRTLRRFQPVRRDDSSLPPAAVVLSVRGADPELAETIEKLLDQDYPCFALHIVVDGDRDPALPLIREVVARRQATNVTVSLLRDRQATCSLKCSALVQAVRELDERWEVVAFVDGDAMPYEAWLRDLVTPLSDPKVGVATGNRWYAPRDASWGSLVRYFWNAAAVVQVWMNGIVWAGSMALRRETIREVGLVEAWSGALSVDATVYRQLKLCGRRVQFVPRVMVLNHERIDLAPFLGWVQRQLIAAKSCDGGWVLVALHTAALTVIQFGLLGLTAAALLGGDRLLAACTATSLFLFWSASLATALGIEWQVRRVVHGYGGQCRWLSLAAVARMFPALLLTYLLFPCVYAQAMFRRRVSWRGVEYEIAGPGRVRMVRHQPVQSVLGTSAGASIV